MAFSFNFFKRTANKKAVAPSSKDKDFGGSGLIGSLAVDSNALIAKDKVCLQFASLHYGVYSQKDRQRVTRHGLYQVLKQPNLDERHWNFFYQSASDYFNGGCLWRIARYEGEVVSLFRMDIKQVTIMRDDKTRRRVFLYNGTMYTQDDVLYIPSRFNYSTLTGGQSIFSAFESAFETSDQLERFTQNSFKNGLAGKRTVVDISGAFPDATPQQIAEIKEKFQLEYMGAQNASRPLIKQKGIEYSELGSAGDNRGAELKDNRQFQRDLVDSVFHLPSESYDIEKYFLFFNEFALRPLIEQFQEAINSLLDEDKYYFEFDTNGVMKSSLQQRIDAYQKEISTGILSLNEARKKENLPPVEAGDTNFMPVNMMPWNEETKKAYMAKQKQIANGDGDGGTDPLDPDTQHIPQGDDKQ